MKNFIQYVVGFAFYGDSVLLIRKNRPVKQAGLLNGIGGKCELKTDLRYVDAMVREFKEECGLDVPAKDWHMFSLLGDTKGEYWRMACFFTHLDSIEGFTSVTDEKVDLYKIDDIMTRKEDCMSNLPWLIGMARDEVRPFPPFIGYEHEKN